MSAQDQYIENMKALLDEMNKSIHEMEASTEKKVGISQMVYRDEMNKLITQSNKVAEKFSELKTVGANAWTETVNEYEKIYHALITSYNFFKSQV